MADRERDLLDGQLQNTPFRKKSRPYAWASVKFTPRSSLRLSLMCFASLAPALPSSRSISAHLTISSGIFKASHNVTSHPSVITLTVSVKPTYHAGANVALPSEETNFVATRILRDPLSYRPGWSQWLTLSL